MKISVRVAPVVALLLLSLACGPVLAQTGKGKDSPERMIEVKKIFGYYDIYLGLSPADRDGFSMTYRLTSRASNARPQLFYVLGNVRTPISMSPNGTILNMPDLNMFRNGHVLRPAGQPSGGVTLDLEAIVPLSRSISAEAASNPLVDYEAAKRRAGPLSLVAPRLASIRFVGVTSGEAIMRDNRRVPLPTARGGGVLYTPSSQALRGGVVSLAFPSVPTDAQFHQ